MKLWRHDIEYKDTQQNDNQEIIWHVGMQQNDTQYNKLYHNVSLQKHSKKQDTPVRRVVLPSVVLLNVVAPKM
jgi:hypothetical protein